MKKIYVLFLVVFVLSCLMMGCGDDPLPSIYDPDYKGNPTPVINSITPEDVAYAVSDEIIIKGENFSPVPADNFVYFNTTKAPVLSSSATELRIMAPNVLGDSVKIKVAVMGAQLFSNIKTYKILPTFIELGDYGPIDAFYAIETDVAGNLYVQVAVGTSGRIDKITPNGEITQYATLGFGTARSMKFGPDGTLWFPRGGTILSKVPPGVGQSSNLASSFIASYSIYDVDFDKNGNMWVVGYHSTATSRRVVKVKDSTVTGEYTFNARFRAVRVFNDYLYVAGLDGSDGDRVKIWRTPIDGNSNLGNFELYYNWSENYTGGINSLTFSTDGTLYVANDGTPTVVAISPDKVATALYPDNLYPSTYNFIWGTGEKYVYLTTRVVASGGDARNKVMKVYMAKDGAPYYGRK